MQAPNTPSMVSSVIRLDCLLAVRNDSAISARMPPSPLLSARMTNSTYLSDTTITIAQNSMEMMPSTAALENGMPCSGLKHSLSAYSGLVPMSPNTTPTAPTTEARRFTLDCGVPVAVRA